MTDISLSNDQNTNYQTKVKTGKIDQLIVYEITDYELDKLYSGSSSSVYLNFAIFLLSVFVCVIIALFTTKISSVVWSVFVSVSFICIVLGSLLLVVWWRSFEPAKALRDKIRQRAVD